MSIYYHFLARGRDVVYPKDMAMVIGLGTRDSKSANVAEPSARVSTYENVTQISANYTYTPTHGQGSLNANSQVVDTPLGLVSNAPLPSNLSIVDSQDIGVGGIYVRNNTLSFTATGLTVTNNGPRS
jgi:hypothetical protein